MQITQIEVFKLENADVKCVSQISDLFVVFINLCDAISE